MSHLSPAAELANTVRQVTHGPLHYFFGYIGHLQTIPGNASGRYILALETRAQDRMPLPGEAADIVLIETHHDDAITVVEGTRAWNPQQGTMLYWNPEWADTQFLSNDHDPETHEVFCVHYDIEKRQRIAEFRYPDTLLAIVESRRREAGSSASTMRVSRGCAPSPAIRERATGPSAKPSPRMTASSW